MRFQKWLPTPQQMSDAAQLRASGFANTTMRQSLGMVVLLGLLAGFPAFLVNWGQAAVSGGALPLARLADVSVALGQMLEQFGPERFRFVQVGELFQIVAGLDQPFPSWLAAFLSALGEWVNWPVRWLSLWVVYGALVMTCNKALGATNRLQPFFAATGFAAVPLLLTALSPLPCLGGIGNVVSIIWAVVVYARANEEVTGLPRKRALTAIVLPLFFVLLMGLLVIGLSVLVALLLVI